MIMRIESSHNSLNNDNNNPFISVIKLWQAYSKVLIRAYMMNL